MTGHPLRPATRQSLGRPSPHQQADRPRAHPPPEKTLSTNPHAKISEYPVLAPVSGRYPKEGGRLLTCYSPVRHSSTQQKLSFSVRLACVKHAASVRPEPGSNSPNKNKTLKPRKTNQPNQPISNPNQKHSKTKNRHKKQTNTLSSSQTTPTQPKTHNKHAPDRRQTPPNQQTKQQTQLTTARRQENNLHTPHTKVKPNHYDPQHKPHKPPTLQ